MTRFLARRRDAQHMGCASKHHPGALAHHGNCFRIAIALSSPVTTLVRTASTTRLRVVVTGPVEGFVPADERVRVGVVHPAGEGVGERGPEVLGVSGEPAGALHPRPTTTPDTHATPGREPVVGSCR